MNGLTEGRMVHYVMGEDSNSPGEHRPAVVTKVFDKEAGTVNLSVFTDHKNDYDKGTESRGLLWVTSIMPDLEGKAMDTWHWIEPA